MRSLVGAATRASVVPNSRPDASNGSKKPDESAKKSPPEPSQAKRGMGASSNGKRAALDASVSERPRVDVHEWQAGVTAVRHRPVFIFDC